MHTTSSRGFTLIELLVVIAIIGLLSGVVLASLNSARSKGRDAKRVSDLKQIQIALELYYDANGNYPTGIIGTQLTAPGFIPAIPKDPQGNGNYRYAALGSGAACTSYHLGATLENPGHTALQNDSDAGSGEAVCTGGGTNFAGTDPVLDLKP